MLVGNLVQNHKVAVRTHASAVLNDQETFLRFSINLRSMVLWESFIESIIKQYLNVNYFLFARGTLRAKRLQGQV